MSVNESSRSNLGAHDAKKMSRITREMTGNSIPFDVKSLLGTFGIELKQIPGSKVKYTHEPLPVFSIPESLNNNSRRFIIAQLLGLYLFSGMKARNSQSFEGECVPDSPSIKTQSALADIFAMESLLPEHEVKKIASTLDFQDSCKYFDVTPAILKARLRMLRIDFIR